MGWRSLSVTFVLLMWDEWRGSREIMIMHSRSRREACLQEVGGTVCVCVSMYWCIPIHLCMSPAGGKSNKNHWRHFDYWWKGLCSARCTHLLGIPWRAGRMCPSIHVMALCDTGQIWWMNWSLLALRAKYIPLLPDFIRRVHFQNNEYMFWKIVLFLSSREIFCAGL